MPYKESKPLERLRQLMWQFKQETGKTVDILNEQSREEFMEWGKRKKHEAQFGHGQNAEQVPGPDRE